jgi:hypothetical protein
VIQNTPKRFHLKIKRLLLLIPSLLDLIIIIIYYTSIYNFFICMSSSLLLLLFLPFTVVVLVVDDKAYPTCKTTDRQTPSFLHRVVCRAVESCFVIAHTSGRENSANNHTRIDSRFIVIHSFIFPRMNFCYQISSKIPFRTPNCVCLAL